ncbi:MAG: hypothetical protein JO313_09245 [Verrucomicrobia bacterium]|nr:hypothetical protein [Verrucomicrobiota bacterium]MBV9130270.1 hypothetical protein [Verrucomicrobiota bacterium]
MPGNRATALRSRSNAVAVSQGHVLFSPPEPVIAAATELSGINAFIELIDADAVRQLADPFKVRISQLIPEQS